MFRFCTTACASLRFALPANTIRLSGTIGTMSVSLAQLLDEWLDELLSEAGQGVVSCGRRMRPRCCYFEWLGRKDSNPRMPESKSGALTSLATPQREPILNNA